MKNFLFIILIFTLSSCKLFLGRVIYGSRLMPIFYSEKRIDKFYDKHSVTKEEYISLSDTAFIQKLNEQGWGFEGWTLYNSDGYQVRRKGDTTKCTPSDYRFFRQFDIREMGYIDSAKHIKNDTIIFAASYRKASVIPTNTKSYSDFDYTLVIYWSRWRGRYSSHIMGLEKAFVLNHPELRINVIKVNMDFREEMENELKRNPEINRGSLLLQEVNQKNRDNK